ncbi:scaffold attachment factor B2 isoform X2 [Aethina tumida]|uniref:scaffold attachment factor B2 isoform X2 n=1 Tax=Aethina tumida TaxID=116153 RepID=UPI00096B4498|nr:scaffold attachment factor B2 isoform X2 [Aethina tumida]
MSEPESKKLSNLRVVDLKAELAKRGLDRNGAKSVLIERLSKVLKEEGENPDTYIFDNAEKKPNAVPSSEDENKAEPNDNEAVAENESKDTNTDPPQKNEEEAPVEAAPNMTDPADDIDGQGLRLTLEEEETLHDDEGETNNDKSSEDAEDDKTNSSIEASKGDVKSKESSSGQEGSKDDKDAGNSSSVNRPQVIRRVKVPPNLNPKVVWISNVAQNTRASELKAALSVAGKVTGAKVVVNARFPGSRCFGYVTMGSVEDADNVIAKLNNTELNGQIIKIDKFDHVRAEQMKQMRMAAAAKGQDKKDSDNKEEGHDKTRSDSEKSPKRDGNKDGSTDKDKNGDDNRNKNGDTKSEDKFKLHDRKHIHERGRQNIGFPKDRRRVRSRSRGRPHSLLTFNKIREERERQRLREKERILREEGRRRHEEAMRQRDVERRQRSEAQRLEREREKLRMEREKIEKEKAELIKLERERQRLEREKIKAEKMELERTLIRLEEDRRAAKRPANFRDNYDERKRTAPDREHFKEPPPPPRFDQPAKRFSTKPREPSPNRFGNSKDYNSRMSYDKKHDQPYPDKRGNSNREYDLDRKQPINPRSGPSSGGSSSNKYDRPYENRDRDIRNRDVPIRSKDNRFGDRDRDRSPHTSFRTNMRDDRDRRSMQDNKGDLMSREHRYQDNSSEPRFDRNNQGGWNSHQSTKQFSSNTKDPWLGDTWRQEPPSDRWNNQGSRSLNQFSGNSNSVPVCPPPPGLSNYPDRFDYNKSLNSGMRKY